MSFNNMDDDMLALFVASGLSAMARRVRNRTRRLEMVAEESRRVREDLAIGPPIAGDPLRSGDGPKSGG